MRKRFLEVSLTSQEWCIAEITLRIKNSWEYLAGSVSTACDSISGLWVQAPRCGYSLLKKKKGEGEGEKEKNSYYI